MANFYKSALKYFDEALGYKYVFVFLGAIGLLATIILSSVAAGLADDVFVYNSTEIATPKDERQLWYSFVAGSTTGKETLVYFLITCASDTFLLVCYLGHGRFFWIQIHDTFYNSFWYICCFGESSTVGSR